MPFRSVLAFLAGCCALSAVAPVAPAAARAPDRAGRIVLPVLTVTALPRTVTLGDPIPQDLQYAITGLVGDDVLGTVSQGVPLCGLANGMPAHAGTYDGAIVCMQGTLTSALYTFAFVPGTLTVLPKAQTITFPKPAALTYGGADAPLTATSSAGLPVGYVSDTPAVCGIVAGAVRALAAGTCTITASSAATADVLAAEPVQTTVEIAKAPLTVTADPATMKPGGPVPPLTATVTGFVNGEDASSARLTGAPACALRPPAPTAPGTHPGAIVCTAGTLTAPNYQPATFVPGAMTLSEGVSASGGGSASGGSAAAVVVKLLTKTVKGAPKLRLKASARVTRIALKLRRRSTTVAKGRLAALRAAKTVRLAPKRRLRKGSYTLEVTWKEASGRAGKAVFRVKAK